MALAFEAIGHGRPVLFMHGMFGRGRNMRSVAGRIASSANVMSILVDLRNHGKSFRSEEHSVSAMANDVSDLIAKNNWTRPVLLGHSMGASVAMHLALKQQQLNNNHSQQLVSNLIVVDMSPTKRPCAPSDILDLLIKGEADNSLSEKVARITDAKTRLFLQSSISRSSDGIARAHFCAKNMANMPENDCATNGLTDPSTKIPTLFVAGQLSNYITDFEPYLSLFPNASLVRIPNADHWVHADAPDAFVSTIVDFLQKHP